MTPQEAPGGPEAPGAPARPREAASPRPFPRLLPLLSLPLLAAAAFAFRGEPRILAALAVLSVPLLLPEHAAALLLLCAGRTGRAEALVGSREAARLGRAVDRALSPPRLAPGDLAFDLLLAALMAFGLMLRAANIDILPVSYDERAAARFAADGTLLSLLRGVAWHDCHPPLFYLLQWASERMPEAAGDLALRLPTLAAGTLAIAVLAELSRRLFHSNGVALLSAALLAVNPWHIHLCRTVRMYPLLFLLALLATIALLDFLERRPGAARRLAGWCALALLTHYMALWLLASLALAALAADGRRAFAGRGRELLRAAAPWLLLLLPWGALVSASLAAKGSLPLTYQLAHPGLPELFATLSLFDWAESGSRFASFLPFLLAGAPLLFPAVRARREARLLYALLLCPLLLNYAGSALTRALSGAGTYQPTHAAYALAPALLLLSSLVPLTRARLAASLLLFLLLVRPLSATLDAVLSAPANPYESALSTAGKFGAPLLVHPDAFALEAVKPGRARPEGLHFAGDLSRATVAASLRAAPLLLELRILAGVAQPQDEARLAGLREPGRPRRTVFLPHPTRPAELTLHGAADGPPLVVRYGLFRLAPPPSLVPEPDGAPVAPYADERIRAEFRWPPGRSTLASPAFLEFFPNARALAGGAWIDRIALFALLLALLSRLRERGARSVQASRPACR